MLSEQVCEGHVWHVVPIEHDCVLLIEVEHVHVTCFGVQGLLILGHRLHLLLALLKLEEKL